MADNSIIYSVDLDIDKFVASTTEALQSLDKLEKGTEEYDAALKKLQDSVNKVSFAKPMGEITKLKDMLNKNPFKLNLQAIDKEVDQMVGSVDDLKLVLDELRKKLDTTTDGNEFNELREAIKLTEQGIKQLSGEVVEADNKFKPLRKRFMELRLALQEMDDAGLSGTEMFKQMELEAARLQDQILDNSASIKTLASDTLALDTGIGGLQGLVAGMQVYEGALAAVGMSSEDLQATTQKLLGLMNLAQGLQEIQNLLQKESAIRKGIDAAATTVQAAATRIMAIGTAQATEAQIALNAAMAANPIGAIAAVIALLVGALALFISSEDDATDSIEGFNKNLEKQNELLNTNLEAIDDFAEVARLRAKLAGKSEEEILNITKKAGQDRLNELRANDEELFRQQRLLSGKTFKDAKEKTEAYESLNKAIVKSGKDINKQIVANEKTELEAAITLQESKKKSAKSSAKAIENIYKDSLRELNKELNSLVLKGEEKLAFELESKRNERLAKINQDLKDKKITKLEAADLRRLAGLISDAELKTAFADFEKARQEAAKAIQDTIDANEQDIRDKRVENLKQGFAKDIADIENTDKKVRDDIQKRREKHLADNQKALQDGIINSTQFAENVDTINKQFDTLLEAQGQSTLNAFTEVAKNKIEKAFTDLQEFNKGILEGIDVEGAEQAATIAEAYSKGEISYTQYQEKLLNIQREYSKKRLQETIAGAENELKAAQEQLSGATDEETKRAAESRIRAAQKTIQDAKKGIADLKVEAAEGLDSVLQKLFNIDPNSEANKAIKSYLNALTTIGEQIKANAQAEVEAADIAIQAQQKRVDEAVKIAEEGNAEYLQQEEDRLKELEIKREAAARKQLAIDAALQASQVIVAVAGAAAQISKGGPANVAAGIASILAALASGAAIIRSLQANQPKFYEGTDYVSRGNNPRGKDTIPAWLHEGEAVIQADKNAAYSPTIKAIRRGLLPANVINDFVKNYSNGVNYQAIGKAVEYKQTFNEGHFIEMNKRLGRLERSMSTTAEAISGLKVNVNMDSDGFSAAIQTHINKRNRILNA
jgi:predicted  nucleic acid-binding Zn-ribbon protein